MNARQDLTATAYFGKLPTRGDFVKGGNHPQLINRLDRWVSAAMEMMSEDPRWKIAYGELQPWDFAFIGARMPVAVCGHLRPSQDSSGRRFPLLAAALVERSDNLLFRCAPLAFAALWCRFATHVGEACGAAEAGPALSEIIRAPSAEALSDGLRDDPLGHFARQHTLAGLGSALALDGLRPDVRRIMLAIGLLLRPLQAAGMPPADKGLNLPLPVDPVLRPAVAALWLYMVSAFLRRGSAELQLLIGIHQGHPRLLLGFNGASPRTLLGALLPGCADEHLIRLDDPEWVDSHPELRSHYGVAKLAAYLSQPAITLEAALNTFREVFLGE